MTGSGAPQPAVLDIGKTNLKLVLADCHPIGAHGGNVVLVGESRSVGPMIEPMRRMSHRPTPDLDTLKTRATA